MNTVTSSSLLKDGLLALHFSSEEIPVVQEKLEGYIRELMLFNAAYDLVGADNQDQIIVNHILDSLSAWKYIQEMALERQDGGQEVLIADIGSGGGLPGIPLAIALPQFQFVLVERMSKRCAFLENCAAVLGLRNVRVENLQAEQVEAASFDIATFRAFRPLDKKMIRTLLRTIKTDGILAAYKAKLESIETEMAGIASIVPEYTIKPLEVPFLKDHQRHLVLIQQ
ncbi:MAG: 16S rRNA (guanine(527)-N(7))-methyltransferase RsmG [Spirochaetaceae bacterium]|nr:16S rRNA (guanine(527)-N(7))-methyltransferase RsmG [Spirochaetaceae bacterium]